MGGITEFQRRHDDIPIDQDKDAVWKEALDGDDMKMLVFYGNLAADRMIEKLKEFSNIAYQLDTEEAHEMARGQMLNVLGSSQGMPM